MGIFDVFKKKKISAAAENELEVLLRKATTQPEYRAELYRKLLSEKLTVIGKAAGKDTNISISSWSDGKIPFFTSAARIYDIGEIKEEVQHFEVKGLDFFTVTKGAVLVLNPYSGYGKEFTPNEVQSMLAGTFLTDAGKELKIEMDTNVLIGQPINYPTDIVNSLKGLFARLHAVNAAYLGWISFSDPTVPPHYIFGLDVNGDFGTINKEAGFTAQQFLKKGEFVDFIQIDNKGGISDYFLNQTKPFYKK